MIPILSNNQIKFIRLLKQKKNRHKFKKYLVEGEKLIQDLYFHRPDLIDLLVFDTEASPFPSSKDIPSYTVDPLTFRSMTNMVNPQGFLAVCHIPETYFLPVLPEFEFALYFDGVQDPGNLGTMLRAAEWFGVRQVLIGSGTVDPFSPKVVQAAMGSHTYLRMNIFGAQELSQLSHTIIGTDMNGSDAYEFLWPDHSILVMGNEGQGMSKAVRDLTNSTVSLPSSPLSKSESLNVSMACTSLLTLRQVSSRRLQ